MKPGDLVAERFLLEQIAGRGGMGVVYRAVDRTSGERVALKVLTSGGVENASDRFLREARVLAGVHHPGIVRYVDHGRTDGGELYLAMEWLEGEDLRARLARRGLTAGESVRLVQRAAEALGAAHARGVVHRDVKPSNLFLVDGDLDRLRLLDFGVARVSDAATRAATRTGVLLGTPGYIAPEQARGIRELDARADVFALGCVLFECLTGRAAFVGEHVMALLAKILLEEAPRLSELRGDLPAPLDALVSRMLAKEPDARPRDGAEVARALGDLAIAGDIEPALVASRMPIAPALTATEQRLLCVVVASDVEPSLLGEATIAGVATLQSDRTVATVPRQAVADTITGAEASLLHDRLDHAARGFGARLERLADGSIVATIADAGAATDQAASAARCALALRQHLPDAPMALATGRGVLAGRWPVGEAIDRAARLLRSTATPVADGGRARAVRLDEVSAGLLDLRFEIGGDRGGLLLRGERDLVESTRTLLGKPTPCVGRDRELAILTGLYDECVAEPVARAVVVIGGAGVGKSRVRHELLRRLKARGEAIEVWMVRGDPLSAGAPYGMIAPALRRAASILDGEPLEVRQQKLRARVARNIGDRDVQRITQFLGELIGAPFPDDASVELRTARRDALLLGDQTRRAFEELLVAETLAGPLLIVLEDLHWGDVPTVKLIDSALRNVPDRPWLVVAIARPEVRELFPSLWAERGVQELRLGELSKRGCEKLVRQVLGAAADPGLVERLVERSGGNAFYLEELLRAVAEGKREDAMPETVVAVVQSRLERLEADARRLLRAASVFGQVFWRGGLLELLGGGGGTMAESWLRELTERELITARGEARFPGEEEYAFRHAMVREAAYGMLTDGDRRLGHRLAAAWLERAGESDGAVLAEHLERGGEPARAVAFYRRAAEQAAAAGDFRAAIARAARAIACGAEGALRGALQLTCAEAHQWLGEFADEERCGAEAMALLPRGSPAWFAAAGEVATAAGKLDHRERLVEAGRAALEVRDGGGAVEITALARAAFQLFFAGQYQLAEELCRRVERAEAEGRASEPGIVARIHQVRSSRALIRGDSGEYLRWERAAAAAFAEAGDLRLATMQRGHVGYACLEVGAFDEAEKTLREVLAAAEKMALHNVVATAKHNLGRALAGCGRLEEALTVEQQAIDASAAQGDRRLEAGSRIYLATMLHALGDLERAEVEARRAVQLAAEPMRPQALATLADVLRARGDLDGALAAAVDAQERLEALGSIEEGEGLVRLAWAETLYAVGRVEEARAAIGAARRRLEERAAAISDPDYRHRFFAAPEPARTLALARALGV